MSEIVTVEATVLVRMRVMSDEDQSVPLDCHIKTKLRGKFLVPADQTWWEWLNSQLPGDPVVSDVIRVKELKREYAGGE